MNGTPKEKARLTAPLGSKESIDDRLQEAVQALARSEGLVCSTPAEIARAKASMKAAVTPLSAPSGAAPRQPPLPEREGEALAARFAAITDPRAQTAFWRSLSKAQRAEILGSK